MTKWILQEEYEGERREAEEVEGICCALSLDLIE